LGDLLLLDERSHEASPTAGSRARERADRCALPSRFCARSVAVFCATTVSAERWQMWRVASSRSQAGADVDAGIPTARSDQDQNSYALSTATLGVRLIR
jgi:hypothetical protein